MFPNTTLHGRYTIKKELGRGGMGLVYLGVDTNGREVAIKRLAPELTGDTAVLERFRREGEALKTLRHPNIVEFIEMFEESGQHFIVTEYIGGGNLLELLRQGPMPMEEVRRITLDICDALVRAHKLEIIHRDIKPENILLTDDKVAKLADFGIARLVNEGSRLTRTGMIVGTPDYLAPEIWNGQTPDAQTDLWSLGVVLFEMMGGRIPFEGDSLVSIMRSITSAPIPNLRTLRPGLPEGMVQIVERLLERDRTHRYTTARQLSADLEAGQPTGGYSTGEVSTAIFSEKYAGGTIPEDGTNLHVLPPVMKPSTPVEQTRLSPPPQGVTLPCMYCGANNDLNAMFCSTCGKSLLVDCPSCGKLVNGSLARCPYCSAEVKEAVKAREKAENLRNRSTPAEPLVAPPIQPVKPTSGRTQPPVIQPVQTVPPRSWVEDQVAGVVRHPVNREPFDPRSAMIREELKAKVSTAKILSSGWWWLIGGLFIWTIGFFSARSTLLQSSSFAGNEDLRQEMEKYKNRARRNITIGLILMAVLFCLFIIIGMNANQ